MKFTIFSPTHNLKYIKRLEKALLNQTFTDFEWLIVPNGKCRVKDVQQLIELPQARIIAYGGKTRNIGEIKQFACNNALGEILVEVDHDDEITPDCLEELNIAFSDPTVDFVYSNDIEINADGTPHVYGAAYGWKYRPFHWNGQEYQECLAFEPSPAAFSKIWYGPNHVRSWRKTFYDRIGGHDPSMALLDDQDIFARSYINGKVKHIDKCLYIYYFHEGNTHTDEKKNAFIQEETLNIHDKYIYKLCERWCDLNNLRKIDLCGGHYPPAGYESVDLANADIIADLNEKWPFEDGSVGLFRAHDALEHLKNPIHAMKEAYRCLAPNGWFLTQTPSTDGRGAFQDPTHISFWNSNSFWYYTKANQAQYIGTPVKFQLNRIKNFYPSEWHKLHNIVYVKADLLKFSGRTPGLIEI